MKLPVVTPQCYMYDIIAQGNMMTLLSNSRKYNKISYWEGNKQNLCPESAYCPSTKALGTIYTSVAMNSVYCPPKIKYLLFIEEKKSAYFSSLKSKRVIRWRHELQNSEEAFHTPVCCIFPFRKIIAICLNRK